MNKYIIVEVIPTSIKKENGILVQLSALKIDELNLIGRFDYRINEDLIPYKELKEVVGYDKECFIYKNTTEEIIDDFKLWIEDYPLLILDNEYTENYLSDIPNNKERILAKLDMVYNDNIIEEIIKKYNLEPTNYIVDLLYEALIYESNKKNI